MADSLNLVSKDHESDIDYKQPNNSKRVLTELTLLSKSGNS